ncbi:gypsy retrotransposon integrase-like protein 1 [Plakobranchus ocellatus]|uniref:Gypsy retrotransposon integrase-like protein 1 n=1 Tax=Plakobranchus ocellatus TaxID=259542 RepID=A0AAV4BLW3_9GAST|nr:gypsy retrotransposon integrase-like protein 1 [Plakobranchus ocellatus]
MVGAATTRAQAKREAVTKPLRVPDIGVDREQLIKLQQEDPRILALVDAERTSPKGGKIVSFEKARGIVYRRYQDLGRNVDVKQVVLPKPLREYVMSVAHDSFTGAHLGIRRTKDKVLCNFYWPGVDGDVTRYCRSCDVCQRTVKKGTVPTVPLENVPLIDTPFKRVAIDLVGPIYPPSEAGHRFILTLVDYATRFAEAVPLRKIDTESVAEALVDIYSRLGVPEEVLSDQGTQFISDCMNEGYIARDQDASQATTDEMPPTSSSAIPAASVTVIENLEGEYFTDSDCEALPELGGWSSEETVNDLTHGDELTLDQRRQLEEVALTRLNKLTIFDPQPMTPPADIFQGMEKDQYFSKIDLSKGYWQIPVRKEDIPKMAFVTMDCHYEFLRMPFGMMNSGATLTRACCVEWTTWWIILMIC